MFEASEKGFHITFANGWTASVQFGRGNYCHNRNIAVGEVPPCPNAEVWAWHKDKRKYTANPIGWQTPEQVAEFIQTVKELK